MVCFGTDNCCCCLCKLQLLVPIVCVISFFYFKNSQNDAQRIYAFTRTIRVAGHRGSPKSQPENTLASMEQARKEGVDAVEFDVSLTKDGVAVLFHDDTLDRTTNRTGPIRDFSLDELKDCNVATKFHEKHDPNVDFMPLNRLEEIVKWALEHKMKMIFDIKDTDEIMVGTIDALFRKYDLYDLVLVSSLYPKVIYYVKRRNPRIIVSFAWCRWTYSYLDIKGEKAAYPDSFLKQKLAEFADKVNMWSATTWLPYFLGADVIMVERSFVSEAYVRDHEAAGRRVIVWTVNDASESRWVNGVLNVAVVSDVPSQVVSSIKS